jgi:hypothetical protein
MAWVFIDMMPADNAESIEESAGRIKDPRLAVFHDPKHVMGRVMRREPADIPPWIPHLPVLQTSLGLETHVHATEAIQNVRTDPYYLQEVLKPRLAQLLAYRVRGGMPEDTGAPLDDARIKHVNPGLRRFLQRREATGLWARYAYRRRRVRDVLETLQHLEAL